MKDYMVDTECQELAKKILEKIESDPRSHNQDTWGRTNSPELEACGTVACAAGWAAILTGNATVFEALSRDPYSKHRYIIRMTSEALELIPKEYRYSEEENMYDFQYLGQHLLGLSERDREILFFCTTNDEARKALQHIARGLPVDWLRILPDSMITELDMNLYSFTHYPNPLLETENG